MKPLLQEKYNLSAGQMPEHFFLSPLPSTGKEPGTKTCKVPSFKSDHDNVHARYSED